MKFFLKKEFILFLLVGFGIFFRVFARVLLLIERLRLFIFFRVDTLRLKFFFRVLLSVLAFLFLITFVLFFVFLFLAAPPENENILPIDRKGNPKRWFIYIFISYIFIQSYSFKLSSKILDGSSSSSKVVFSKMNCNRSSAVLPFSWRKKEPYDFVISFI